MKNINRLLPNGSFPTILILILLISSKLMASTSVAIYPFQSNNLSPAQVSIYTDQLRSLLVNSAHFEVIERERLNLIMEEQGLSSSGSTVEAIELGKLLKVDYILTGDFSQNAGRIYATAELINTKTSQIERSVRIQSEQSEKDFIQKQLPILVKKLENPDYITSLPKTKSWAWILSGGAFLSGATGMYFEAKAQDALQDFKANPNQKNLAQIEDAQNLRDYSYYTAGAIATTAIVLWFWPEAEADHIALVPQHNGIILTGRF